MRRSGAVVAVGMLAGATTWVTAGPARAQVCTSTDPVLAAVCHYYQEAGEAAYRVYCKVSPPCR